MDHLSLNVIEVISSKRRELTKLEDEKAKLVQRAAIRSKENAIRTKKAEIGRLLDDLELELTARRLRQTQQQKATQKQVNLLRRMALLKSRKVA